ncbi:MAG: hypothetical protein ACRC1W_05380 [Shewanella sp.]
MPNPAFSDRCAAKLARGFVRLADPCEFTPQGGAAYSRAVNLTQVEDTSVNGDYLEGPITRAEFLLSEGAVTEGDAFSVLGLHYRLTAEVGRDSITACFTYVEL